MGGKYWWGHTLQYTGDVLWICTPETCIILLAAVTPLHSIKGKDPTHSILVELKENLPCQVKPAVMRGRDSGIHTPSLWPPSSRPCPQGHWKDAGQREASGHTSSHSWPFALDFSYQCGIVSFQRYFYSKRDNLFTAAVNSSLQGIRLLACFEQCLFYKLSL